MSELFRNNSLGNNFFDIGNLSNKNFCCRNWGALWLKSVSQMYLLKVNLIGHMIG